MWGCSSKSVSAERTKRTSMPRRILAQTKQYETLRDKRSNRNCDLRAVCYFCCLSESKSRILHRERTFSRFDRHRPLLAVVYQLPRSFDEIKLPNSFDAILSKLPSTETRTPTRIMSWASHAWSRLKFHSRRPELLLSLSFSCRTKATTHSLPWIEICILDKNVSAHM